MSAVELHAVVEGPAEAPVVVLAGSLGSTLEMWDAQVPALTERFRVVRFDARGHGRSPVPAGPYVVDDLVDDLLALLCTSAKFASPSAWAERAATVRGEGTAAVAEAVVAADLVRHEEGGTA